MASSKRAADRPLKGPTSPAVMPKDPGHASTQQTANGGRMVTAGQRGSPGWAEAGGFAGLAGLSPQLTGGSLRAAATVARAWIEQWDNHRAGLVSALGEQLVEERQADRRAELRAIENGVLSRSLFTAVRPGPSAQEPSRRPRPGLRTWDNLAAALSPDLRGCSCHPPEPP